MSCKSLIYVANTAATAVIAGGVVPISSISPVRRRGNDVNLSGNAIAITDCGSNYYLVTVNATFTAPAAGNVTLNLQQNGTNVTGATATETITTADTETRSISYSAIVRTFNNQGIDSLTLVNSGVAATFSNVAISVIKL